MNFEQYLQDKHAINYAGTDDNMPEAYTDWLCDKDPDDLITYAQAWHEAELKKLYAKIETIAKKGNTYASRT